MPWTNLIYVDMLVVINMGKDQSEKTWLENKRYRLKGKSALVFTTDGQKISGEVIEVDETVLYVNEGEKTRMIMASAIASISMSIDDVKEIMAPDKLSIPMVG
jgi:sRNA-binding regulator protein Hfq